MSGMHMVGAGRHPEQAEPAEPAEPAEGAQRHPSVIRRTVDALVCWWVLLRARLLRTGRSDPEVELCLQLQKGARFQIRGGEVHFVDSGGHRADATVSSFSSGRSGNDE